MRQSRLLDKFRLVRNCLCKIKVDSPRGMTTGRVLWSPHALVYTCMCSHTHTSTHIHAYNHKERLKIFHLGEWAFFLAWPGLRSTSAGGGRIGGNRILRCWDPTSSGVHLLPSSWLRHRSLASFLSVLVFLLWNEPGGEKAQHKTQPKRGHRLLPMDYLLATP